MASYDIVVAVENNRYLQVQAMVCHYSCVQRLGVAPLIVVHMDDDPLSSGFRLIQEHGGRLQLVPSLRYVDGVEYPPRNSAAALRYVQTTADYVVLCDADMVFLKPLPLDSFVLPDQAISFDRVDYLNPNRAPHASDIAHACANAGVDPAEITTGMTGGGVPHVFPWELLAPFSAEWLRWMELFPLVDRPIDSELPRYAYPKGPHRPWLTAMWAMILAAKQLQLQSVETSWCLNNRDGTLPLPNINDCSQCLLHYCFGDSGFDKRQLNYELDVTDPAFWRFSPADETVSGFLRQQFLEAARFYGVSDR